jgi:hypothetical protein
MLQIMRLRTCLCQLGGCLWIRDPNRIVGSTLVSYRTAVRGNDALPREGVVQPSRLPCKTQAATSGWLSRPFL